MKTYKFFTGLGVYFIVLLVSTSVSSSQWRISSPGEPSPGYLKFDYSDDTTTTFYLVDNYGQRVREKSDSRFAGMGLFKPYADGSWSSARGETVFLLDSAINIVDSISYPDFYGYDMHDVTLLPNGRYLLLAIVPTPIDMSKIVPGGREDAETYVTVVIETDPSGEIFWEWNPLDHMSVLDCVYPDDLDNENFEFNHANSVELDLDGNMLISHRHLDEITKVNRSTGEIIWRMGGSTCRNNEFEFVGDTIDGFFGFSHQHSINVLDNGNILIFDNGNLRPDPFSRAVEYEIDEDRKIARKVWEYRATPDIYTISMGSVSRLANGNTLINWTIGDDGVSDIFEVKPDGTIAYKFDFYGRYAIYRAFRVQTGMKVGRAVVRNTGNYSLGGGSGVSVSVDAIQGSGEIFAAKHFYLPPQASYYNEDFVEILPARWVLTRVDIGDVSGTIKFDLSSLQGIQEEYNIGIFRRDGENLGEFRKLTTNYDPQTRTVSARTKLFGEFVLASYALDPPELLEPANAAAGVAVDSAFKWSSSKGATRYRVMMSQTEDFGIVEIDKIITTDTIFRPNSLVNGAEYFWKVSSISPFDVSDFSEIRSFTVKLSPPKISFPEDRATGVLREDSARWEPAVGATRYRIRFSVNPYFETVEIDTIIEDNAFSLGELEEGISHYWQIKSISDRDESEFSEISAFAMKTPFVSDSPSLYYPPNGAVIPADAIEFSWSYMPEAKSYELQISLDSAFSDLAVDSSGLESSSQIITGLKKSTTYYWRARAFSSKDSTLWSATRLFTTADAQIYPAPALSEPGNGSFGVSRSGRLTWEPVTIECVYEVRLSKSPDMNEAFIISSEISDNFFDYSDLDYKTDYYWCVKYFVGSDSSLTSEIWSFKTEDRSYLQAPKLHSPENGFYPAPLEVELTWDPIPGAKEYVLQLSLNRKFSPIMHKFEGVKKTSVVARDLDNDTEYFWRVFAFADSSSSKSSEVRSFKTAMISPVFDFPNEPGKEISATGEISWSSPPGVESFALQISESPEFENIVIDEPNLLEPRYNYFLSSGNYSARVKALKPGAESFWAETFFAVGTESSVFEISKTIVISPNPASESIELDMSEFVEPPREIRFSDLGGKVVFSQSLSESTLAERVTIDVVGIPAGVYLVIVESESSLFAGFLVIR